MSWWVIFWKNEEEGGCVFTIFSIEIVEVQ